MSKLSIVLVPGLTFYLFPIEGISRLLGTLVIISYGIFATVLLESDDALFLEDRIENQIITIGGVILFTTVSYVMLYFLAQWLVAVIFLIATASFLTYLFKL